MKWFLKSVQPGQPRYRKVISRNDGDYEPGMVVRVE